MAKRVDAFHSIVMSFAGLKDHKGELNPFPFFTTESKMEGKPQKLGEYCMATLGVSKVETCKMIFGVDEQRLEELACRTCPN